MPDKPSRVSGKSPAGDNVLKEDQKKKTEIVALPEVQETPETRYNIEGLLTLVVTEKMPMETLERILAMRKELKAEYAKEQFDIAMSYFQAHCPVIEKVKAGGKTKDAKDPAYYYAPLDHILHSVQDLLEKTGLSYTFDARKEGLRVIVTCFAKHKSGHERPTIIDVPMGTGTNIMSAPQVEMATMTFAKRYAFCNAFGIVTGGEDSDAQEVVVDTRSVQNTTGVGSNGNVFVAGAAGPVTPTEDANCAECGNLIQEPSVVAFSIARYKKPVCRSCQSKLSPSV